MSTSKISLTCLSGIGLGFAGLAVALPAAATVASVTCHGVPATIVGTDGAEVFTETTGKVSYVGSKAADDIAVEQRADAARIDVRTGRGNDTVRVDGGRSLYADGGAGADRVDTTTPGATCVNVETRSGC